MTTYAYIIFIVTTCCLRAEHRNFIDSDVGLICLAEACLQLVSIYVKYWLRMGLEMAEDEGVYSSARINPKTIDVVQAPKRLSVWKSS